MRTTLALAIVTFLIVPAAYAAVPRTETVEYVAGFDAPGCSVKNALFDGQGVSSACFTLDGSESAALVDVDDDLGQRPVFRALAFDSRGTIKSDGYGCLGSVVPLDLTGATKVLVQLMSPALGKGHCVWADAATTGTVTVQFS